MTRPSLAQFSTKREKSWSKAVWMTASGPLGAARESVGILERAAEDFGAGPLERGGARIRARHADDLVAGPDEFRGRDASR